MNSIGRSHLPDVLMVNVTRWILKCHPRSRGQFVLWGSVLYFWPQTVQFRGGGGGWYECMCVGGDSSGTIYLFLLKQCLSLAGSSSLRLDWVASESQRGTCLCLPRTPLELQTHRTKPSCFVLFGIFFGSKLGTRVPVASTLLTNLSPQPNKYFLWIN